MSSTFYSDVTAALQVHQITEHIEPMLHDAMQMEEHTSNGDPTDVEVMSSVELIGSQTQGNIFNLISDLSVLLWYYTQ